MEKINYYFKALSQELELLNRIIYKFKNQHGRLGYFKSIFRITKELKIFCIALQETFYNKNSTENAENYYKNLRDLRRIVRRIKWDLKDAGTSISRLLSHGFFLPMVFLLFSTLSRVFSVIINIKVTIDSTIPTIPFKPSNVNQNVHSSTNDNKSNYNNGKKSTNLNCRNSELSHFGYFNEEDDDLGEIVSYNSLIENSNTIHNHENDTLSVANNNDNLESNSGVKDLLVDSTSEQTVNKEICTLNSLENNTEPHNNDMNESLSIEPIANEVNVFKKLIRAWNIHMILRSKRRKLVI
ncbi:uncharacterized protein cubi_01260 [Cryptosporidium ubiquitum]|uniref:Nucleolus and neural progenitor protein-like N-terminal domain-containing protein n=1 Tax=Cryptosporidium ubiquitum TaxID=857276 RepID=A0A1J4MHA1_9CRYT|nr:uncharacterized protein cubi_01260 [Cryptosporidium ubiquitum]OII72380.1 hypothetical protein cubi_01260 [Cryptosporidium ubiquitum]